MPHAAIRRRKQLLRTAGNLLARNQSLLGQVLTVLPDGAPLRRQCLGRSNADAPEVDQSVLFGPSRGAEKTFAQVRITAADAYQLSGEEILNRRYFGKNHGGKENY